MYPSAAAGQEAFYGGVNMNNGLLYNDQANYNQPYPNGGFGMFNAPFRSGMFHRRTAAFNADGRPSSTA